MQLTAAVSKLHDFEAIPKLSIKHNKVILGDPVGNIVEITAKGHRPQISNHYENIDMNPEELILQYAYKTRIVDLSLPQLPKAKIELAKYIFNLAHLSFKQCDSRARVIYDLNRQSQGYYNAAFDLFSSNIESNADKDNTDGGNADGDDDGNADGDDDGNADGDDDGNADGDDDGNADGDDDGNADGNDDGNADGDNDGNADGDDDGNADGNDGGNADGDDDGNADGDHGGNADCDDGGNADGDDGGNADGDGDDGGNADKGDGKGDDNAQSKGDSIANNKGDGKGDGNTVSKDDGNTVSKGDGKSDGITNNNDSNAASNADPKSAIESSSNIKLQFILNLNFSKLPDIEQEKIVSEKAALFGEFIVNSVNSFYKAVVSILLVKSQFLVLHHCSNIFYLLGY